MTIKNTKEEIQVEEKTMREKQDSVAEGLFNKLDLSLDDEKKEEEVEEEKEVKEEVKEEDENETQEEKEEEEVEEEEMIPLSKFKKRLSSEKAKREIAEARLKEVESKPAQTGNKDKLEAMSKSELKALKVNAKSELRELIRSGEDVGREQQIDDLIDEINDVMNSSESTFAKKQVSSYDEAVKDVMASDDNEGIDFEKSSKEIKDIAFDIYNRYPELQKMVSGQATALKMAVDHFREVSSKVKDKSKNIKQKQEINKLKRKTSVDSGSKTGISKADFSKRRKEARESGNTMTREAFVTDMLDSHVDKYLPERLRK